MLRLLLLSLITTWAWSFSDLSSEEMTTYITEGEGDVVVIDVRTPQEWAQTGIIASSQPIMYFDDHFAPHKSEFLSQLSQVVNGNKNKTIILICRSGQRSKLVAGILEREGYTKVFNHKNGILEWLAENRPVTKKPTYVCCQ